METKMVRPHYNDQALPTNKHEPFSATYCVAVSKDQWPGARYELLSQSVHDSSRRPGGVHVKVAC